MHRVLILVLCFVVAAESHAATSAGPGQRLRPSKARKPIPSRAKRIAALALAALMLPGVAGAVGPVFDPVTQADQVIVFKWDPPVPGVGRVHICHSSVTPYVSADFARRYTMIGGREPTAADSQISGKVSVWYEGQHYFKAAQYKDVQLPADWEKVRRCADIPGKMLGTSGDMGFVIGKATAPMPPMINIGGGQGPKPPVLR